VELIQVCSNEWDRPSPRGVNSKTAKYTENFQKSFSPEPASQIQSNLIQSILG
jgi:hypothetical protein